MNNYQIAKHQSNQLVVTEAKNNQASVDIIPSFAKGIEALDGINILTEQAMVQQSKNIKGISTSKDNQISNLIDSMIDISGAMHSYAKTNGDSVLQTKIDYKISAIDKMTFPKLVTAASIVLEQAQMLPADVLAQEGISASELNDFAALLQLVKNSKSLPREAIIDRSGVTDTLVNLLAQAQGIVSTLDRLATQFKRKDPVFYLKYKAARTISVSSPQKVANITTTVSTNGTNK